MPNPPIIVDGPSSKTKITLPAPRGSVGGCDAEPNVARNFTLAPIDTSDEFSTILVEVSGTNVATIDIRGKAQWKVTIK